MDESIFYKWQKKYADTVIDTFEIYQLKDDIKLLPYLFESFSYVTKNEHRIKLNDYKPVYISNLSDLDLQEETNELDMLDVIYETFNINRPEDFNGHSLSVSDVVVIKKRGKDVTSYYVDNFGYKEVPEFFGAEKVSEKNESEME